MLSAADEPVDLIVHGWANERRGCVDEIVTARDRDLASTVSAFAIGRTDGRLTLLNTVRSGGAGPAHLSVHPAGKHLLVANYSGGSIANAA